MFCKVLVNYNCQKQGKFDKTWMEEFSGMCWKILIFFMTTGPKWAEFSPNQERTWLNHKSSIVSHYRPVLIVQVIKSSSKSLVPCFLLLLLVYIVGGHPNRRITRFSVKFSVLRFSIISIVDIPLNILWNYQFLIWCNFCVIITFIESCYFILS